MKKYIVGILLLTILLLSGCIGVSAEKQLSAMLSEMNDAEKGYREIQDDLSQVEKSEQLQFIAAMELTREQPDELKGKVTQLEEQLAQRLELLKQEEKAMKKAEKVTAKFEAIIETAEDEQKEQLKQLKSAVEERYMLHKEFMETYKNLASQQKMLYGMLIVEGTEYRKLESQVNEVNAQNEIVQAAVSAFNISTEKANEVKEQVLTSLQQE